MGFFFYAEAAVNGRPVGGVPRRAMRHAGTGAVWRGVRAVSMIFAKKHLYFHINVPACLSVYVLVRLFRFHTRTTTVAAYGRYMSSVCATRLPGGLAFDLQAGGTHVCLRWGPDRLRPHVPVLLAMVALPWRCMCSIFS